MRPFERVRWSSLLLGCCERPSRNPDSGLARLIGKATKPSPSTAYASELPKVRPEAAGILLLGKKTTRGVSHRAARGAVRRDFDISSNARQLQGHFLAMVFWCGLGRASL